MGSECHYRERVTLSREDYESWAMGIPTPIDDPGTTGDPSEPTTGVGSTTDAGTSGTGGAMLDEQQVCEMVCAKVTPNDPYAGGFAQCQVDGAMGTGNVQIDCLFSIGCA
ncbi:hypothetical protein [Nannocystis pusilla]|uniref:Uncharacterized protein n=1 Tax=Nannocystis pusilla TaxID=889268 RepID=A0ABS7U5Z7_9BACT|nr:hypothetical protein [Nannocystis pusilla]MBZ5715910.1 hypothetical protein [Nannocystis pusilla]